MPLPGHETTANTLAWALFSLSQKPAVQTRLREELCAAFPGDSAPAELETLNALPYLDAVVRETLRFHAAVELVGRVAEEDDVVQVDKGYFARDGSFHDHIR
jgi:cytochrome P450